MIVRRPVRGHNCVDITWRVRAITSSKSGVFAERMERELNEATKEGFALVQMIERPEDSGCVLVMQRAELQEEVGVVVRDQDVGAN